MVDLYQHRVLVVSLAAVWLGFVIMEVAKGIYFNGSDTPFVHYTLFGLYLYLPWFGVSVGLAYLAKQTLPHSLLSSPALSLHVPTSLLWAGCHVLILTSAYWVFWLERVARVTFDFVLGEQAFKWFHFEVLAYFLLLSIWRRELKKSEAINASSSSSDGNGMLSLLTDSGTVRMKIDEIDWLLADDNYVIVHSAQRKVRVRGTMKEMLKQLHQGHFKQTHRSAIVNMSKVREIGNQRITLTSGYRVPVSRRRHRQLVEALNS
ncbi:MAG: LytTR family transcriptional regulator [Pseudomonadales bacterium]|nr:LytTR family transcriptional regulator [Pseudomonadales bacterium]